MNTDSCFLDDAELECWVRAVAGALANPAIVQHPGVGRTSRAIEHADLILVAFRERRASMKQQANGGNS